MISKKSIAVAFGCALAMGVAGVASASPITVDGVTWDPDSGIDLQVQGLNMRETAVSTVGDVLNGYGQVGQINGNTSFCSGCDLSFVFSYTVSAINGNQIAFDNGTISFYVQPAGTFSQLDPSSANSGTLWLTLSGHTGSLVTFPSLNGQLLSSVNGPISEPTLGSTGQGWLDATNGPASQYMQTHSQADGLGGFADFSINSSFLTQMVAGCPGSGDEVCNFPIQGVATLQGKSAVSVPEPGALGMLGLGMGVLGFFFWRRRREASDRA